jgi:hypothetical protein
MRPRLGATAAFSRSPLSRASRPFIRSILKVAFGSPGITLPVGMVLSLLKPEADALVASGGATYDPGPWPSDRVGAEQRPVRIETR